MVEGAEKFQAYLEAQAVDGFQIEELHDEGETVLFRTAVTVQGQFVPLAVIFDQTIYVVIRANVAPKAMDDTNAYALEALIRRLNYQNKLFKYYVTPDASILLDACVPMLPENFSAELLYTMVNVVAHEIETRHAEWMNTVWQT